VIRTLSLDLQQALDTDIDKPLQLLDPRTKEIFVLLPAKQYEWIQGLLEDGPLTRTEQQKLLREAGKRAGWDDPELDVYDDLDPRKQP